MPTYCYRGERTGEIVEKVFRMGEAPEQFVGIDGQLFRRDFAAERKGFPPTAGWPIESYATGVHPSQADELRKHLADRGVPTDVTKEGNPVWRDSNHKKKCMKARGFIDRASFL